MEVVERVKTMKAMNKVWSTFSQFLLLTKSPSCHRRSKGQAAVEFTLIFILLLVVAWIPADFGLALYTGQIAQNAAREGARIAASDPNLTATVAAGSTVTCNYPCGSAANLLQVTANRMPGALMPNTVVAISLTAGPLCNQQITMTVTGTYNYFFARLLKMVRGGSAAPSSSIQRSTVMRWEHQDGCLP